MGEDTRNWHKRIFLLIVGVFLLLVGLAYYYFQTASFSYQISNVPYDNVFSREEALSLGGDVKSSARSILYYWGADLSEIEKISSIELNEVTKQYTLTDLGLFFNSLGDYNVSVEHLRLSELKKYINEERNIPLLVYMPLVEGGPSGSPYTALVLIGIDGKTDELIFHSYWFGNNLRISFEEFTKAYGLRKSDKIQFLVIEPKNSQKGSLNFSYPERTPVMGRMVSMLKNYLVGTTEIEKGEWENAILYLKGVESDPDFEVYFPPFFKVKLWGALAFSYGHTGDLKLAREYVERALESNEELNREGEGGWQGVIIKGNVSGQEDKLSYPYTVNGFLLLKEGKTNEAIVAFRRALSINANDFYARSELQRLGF